MKLIDCIDICKQCKVVENCLFRQLLERFNWFQLLISSIQESSQSQYVDSWDYFRILCSPYCIQRVAMVKNVVLKFLGCSWATADCHVLYSGSASLNPGKMRRATLIIFVAYHTAPFNWNYSSGSQLHRKASNLLSWTCTHKQMFKATIING